MTLLLILILVATPPVEFMPAPQGNDMAFILAGEEFVRAAKQPNRLEAVMSPADARLIRMLGCSGSDCRDTAAELLHARGWDANRALIWGTWLRDESIRSRSLGLLAQLACPWCLGTGLCPECGGFARLQTEDKDWCRMGKKSWIRNSTDVVLVLVCLCAECGGTGKPHLRPSN